MVDRFCPSARASRTRSRFVGHAWLGVWLALAPLACDSAEGTDDGAGGSTGGSGQSGSGTGGMAATSGKGGSAGVAGSGSGGVSGTGGGKGGAAGSSASSSGGTAGEGGATGESGTAGESGTSGDSGASSSSGASGANGGGSGGSGGTDTSACDDPNLVWRSARKTNYTSYPDPNSEECIEYNGCMWAGQFAACDGVKSEAWVAAHNIAAAFPSFDDLALHDLCLRQGNTRMIVTVLDTCGDDDCDGCCTRNQGSADQLIDLESYTNERWGLPDAQIEWADLGPTRGDGCD